MQDLRSVAILATRFLGLWIGTRVIEGLPFLLSRQVDLPHARTAVCLLSALAACLMLFAPRIASLLVRSTSEPVDGNHSSGIDKMSSQRTSKLAHSFAGLCLMTLAIQRFAIAQPWSGSWQWMYLAPSAALFIIGGLMTLGTRGLARLIQRFQLIGLGETDQQTAPDPLLATAISILGLYLLATGLTQWLDVTGYFLHSPTSTQEAKSLWLRGLPGATQFSVGMLLCLGSGRISKTLVWLRSPQEASS